MDTPYLYLQLYSLRHETAVDPEDTLGRLSEMGFGGVELAGDYGWSASKWREVLERSKLSALSMHVGLEALESTLSSRVAFAREIGCHTIVVPSLPKPLQTAAGYQEAAKRLNDLGKTLSDEGFSLGYHNHAFEFEPTETAGSLCGMDTLLAETEPNRVHFEFDTFWLEYAGLDAVDYIRRHSRRVSIIHAKYLRKRDREDVPAGAGDVDFPTLMSMCSANSWPVVLEYESGNAMEAVRRGAAHLRPLLR